MSCSEIRWRNYSFFVTNIVRTVGQPPEYSLIGPEDDVNFSTEVNLPPSHLLEAARRFLQDRYAGLTLEDYLERMFPDEPIFGQ